MDWGPLPDIDLDALEERPVRQCVSLSCPTFPLPSPMTNDMERLILPPTPTRPGGEHGLYAEQQAGIEVVMKDVHDVRIEHRTSDALNDFGLFPVLAPVNRETAIVRSSDGTEVSHVSTLPVVAVTAASSAAALTSGAMATPPVRVYWEEHVQRNVAELRPTWSGEECERQRTASGDGHGNDGHGNDGHGNDGEVMVSGGHDRCAVHIAPGPDPSPVGVQEARFYSTAPCTPQMGTRGAEEKGKAEVESGPEPLKLEEVAEMVRQEQFESIVDKMDKLVLEAAVSAKLRLRGELKKSAVSGSCREARVTRRKQEWVCKGYRNVAVVLLEYLYRQQQQQQQQRGGGA